MTADYVWLRKEFPWLASGFIHAVADDYADLFAVELQRLGFSIATLDAGSPQEFRDRLGTALGFPDFRGHSWAADPKLFGEASFMLVHEFESLGYQAELVITGSGEAFKRPGSA